MPTRSVGPHTQDWNEIVISKRTPRSSETKDKKAVTEALRSGSQVETSKKYDGGKNKSGSSSTESMRARKLEQETDIVTLEKVSTDVKQAIQKARIEKKLTQAQLAQLINEKPQVIQEYESGKAIPNNQILGKMERALGTKLRGKLK